MDRKKLNEILRYLLCGFIVTVVSWGSYALFVNKLGLSVFSGNLLSWVLAVIVAFFINKLWVFRSFTWEGKKLAKEAVTFVSGRIVSGVLEIAGVPLLEKLGFDNPFYSIAKSLGLNLGFFYTDGIYSKIAVGIVVLILNYVIAKLIVFRHKEKQ